MKGNRPDFHKAMENEKAKQLYNEFLEYLRKQYKEDRVFGGAFGEYMELEIIGDGPVTLELESKEYEKAKEKLEKQN